jgi:hypothetical protein
MKKSVSKKASPKKGSKVLHFDVTTGADVKEALSEAKAKSKPQDVAKAIAKLKATAPKISRHVQGAAPATKAEKPLTVLAKHRQTFLEFHKAKGIPKFNEGSPNIARYEKALAYGVEELIEAKEFTNLKGGVSKFFNHINGRQLLREDLP